MEDYAPPTLDVARHEITTLLELYEKATGFGRTFVIILATAGSPTRGNEEAKGNPKFGKGYLKADFGHATYDRFNSRMSALWPDDLEWPQNIPRQKPVPLGEATVAKLAEKLNAVDQARAKQQRETATIWPQGLPWPSDIPKPASMEK